MVQCFDGIGFHGLPMLSLPPEAEGVDYPYLSDRFKKSLAAIIESIIEKLPIPR
jgi:hypothetical protein